jgi:hypothetical protein
MQFPSLSLTVQWVASATAYCGDSASLSSEEDGQQASRCPGGGIAFSALALTIAGMLTTNTDAEWLGLMVALIWAAIVITSAYVFPDLIGRSDQWSSGRNVLNAGFLTAMAFVAIRIASRPPVPVTGRMTFACPTCKQQVYGWRVLRISPSRRRVVRRAASGWAVLVECSHHVPVLLLLVTGLYVTCCGGLVPIASAVAAACGSGFST